MQTQSSYGFCAGNSPMAGSVGFGYEVSPTLSSGQSGTNIVPTVIYDADVIDRAAFNQDANAQYIPHIERTQVMDTLVARGPHAVCYDAGDGSE